MRTVFGFAVTAVAAVASVVTSPLVLFGPAAVWLVG